jgi:hypothetical protein
MKNNKAMETNNRKTEVQPGQTVEDLEKMLEQKVEDLIREIEHHEKIVKWAIPIAIAGFSVAILLILIEAVR